MSLEDPEVSGKNGFEGDEWILHSDPSEATDAIEVLEKRLAVLEWDEDIAYKFSLAVSEVLANAIVHGNEGDINKKVIVELSITKDDAEVIVRDEGGAMVDFDKVPDPTDDEGLMKTSGRGTHSFIKLGCDFAQFTAPGEVTLRKKNNAH